MALVLLTSIPAVMANPSETKGIEVRKTKCFEALETLTKMSVIAYQASLSEAKALREPVLDYPYLSTEMQVRRAITEAKEDAWSAVWAVRLEIAHSCLAEGIEIALDLK